MLAGVRGDSLRMARVSGEVAFKGLSWATGETDTLSVRAALLSKWTTNFSSAFTVTGVSSSQTAWTSASGIFRDQPALMSVASTELL